MGSAPQNAATKPQVSRKRPIALAIGLIVLGLGAFLVFVVALVTGIMRGSEPYKTALSTAQQNPAVIKSIGSPIKASWFAEGNIEVTSTSGNADIAIPVLGPNGKGTVYAVAKKTGGAWQYSLMEFRAAGSSDRIDLLTPDANSH